MKNSLVLLAGLVALPMLAVASGPEWSWQEAAVDQQGDYLELQYGSGDADPESWFPVARVGPPRGHVFPVQWLVDPEAVENEDLIEAVENDLDFYLKDVGRPDPWSYAQYHCGTASNWYGHVHWLCAVGSDARSTRRSRRPPS